jgi:hypothetical protein
MEASVSLQMESRHYLKVNDTVQDLAGRVGRVVESFALYARVEWNGGRQEEVDQFDPRIEVIDRASEPS